MRLVWAIMIAALVLIAVLDFGSALGVPNAVDAILTVLAGFAFMCIHAWIAWGWKNALAFIVITAVISFASEALGVATGFVFGAYHYTNLLGPKLLGVPLLIQMAYIAVGYASIVVARTILSKLRPVAGWSILAVAIAGAMVMVSWDVSMDPLQSTASGDWIWANGGPYFGVGMHNYVGWFCTVFVFMFAYYLFARHTSETERAALIGNRSWFWALPAIYYGLMALNVIAGAFLGGVTLPYASPQNYSGTPTEMSVSLALVATFAMGIPVVFALARLGTSSTRES